jgi:hypothetical protein
MNLEINAQMKDNIRKDLQEIGWEVVDWMHVAQDRGQRRLL